MILMIWSSDRAKDCALSIEQALDEPVHVAASLYQGCEQLRLAEYSAVVIDQWITEAEPEPANLLFDHLGMAVPLVVNFGISGNERIVRELRAALARRGHEMMLARHAARLVLREELKDDVTALLLSCGVALGQPGLNEALTPHLKNIEELAAQIRSKLAISDNEHATTNA